VGGVSDSPLLELLPQTSHLASEWLDGLLMLLHQPPITQETTSLVNMMEDWGVRLRILNLRWEDVDWESLERSVKGDAVPVKEVPSREGLDLDFWYAMPET
jgi:engulfment/cell motility protein 1